MTSVELRRLADQKMAEAAQLTDDAERLRPQAASLRGLLDPLVGMSQRAWVGPAAEDFEAAVRVHSQRIDEQADRLGQVAAQFLAAAAALRREAGVLRRQALEMESAASAAGVAMPSGVV